MRLRACARLAHAGHTDKFMCNPSGNPVWNGRSPLKYAYHGGRRPSRLRHKPAAPTRDERTTRPNVLTCRRIVKPQGNFY